MTNLSLIMINYDYCRFNSEVDKAESNKLQSSLADNVIWASTQMLKN